MADPRVHHSGFGHSYRYRTLHRYPDEHQAGSTISDTIAAARMKIPRPAHIISIQHLSIQRRSIVTAMITPSVKIRSYVALSILLMILILSACGLDQTLVVGVETGFEPFAFVEGKDEQGFDVDLWEAAAKEAGIKYKFKPMGQGEMLAALQRGEIDVALAGITIKKDRRQSFDFTLPYYDTGLVMLTQADNDTIHNVTQLEGKTVVTKTGSSAYDYAKKVKGIKEIRAFPEIEQAYEELLNKRADVAIFDEANAKHYMNEHRPGKVKIVGNKLTNEQYAFAFQKGNRLVGRVNNALRKLSKDGTYEKLYQKWFDQKPTSQPGDT